MVLGRTTYVVCSSGIFIIISGSGPSINDVTRITELLIAPYPHVIPFPICNTMRHRCFLKFLALKDGDIIYKRAPPRTDGSLGHRHSAELCTSRSPTDQGNVCQGPESDNRAVGTGGPD